MGSTRRAQARGVLGASPGGRARRAQGDEARSVRHGRQPRGDERYRHAHPRKSGKIEHRLHPRIFHPGRCHWGRGRRRRRPPPAPTRPPHHRLPDWRAIGLRHHWSRRSRRRRRRLLHPRPGTLGPMEQRRPVGIILPPMLHESHQRRRSVQRRAIPRTRPCHVRRRQDPILHGPVHAQHARIGRRRSQRHRPESKGCLVQERSLSPTGTFVRVGVRTERSHRVSDGESSPQRSSAVRSGVRSVGRGGMRVLRTVGARVRGQSRTDVSGRVSVRGVRPRGSAQSRETPPTLLVQGEGTSRGEGIGTLGRAIRSGSFPSSRTRCGTARRCRFCPYGGAHLLPGIAQPGRDGVGTVQRSRARRRVRERMGTYSPRRSGERTETRRQEDAPRSRRREEAGLGCRGRESQKSQPQGERQRQQQGETSRGDTSRSPRRRHRRAVCTRPPPGRGPHDPKSPRLPRRGRGGLRPYGRRPSPCR
mmetsp:Transcript_60131/g.178295  ORF Transcript_60131/g.178295 Transcript_60131/m.178295 type:complete len:476 (-) Transcript_60131:271-1698(-)